MNAIQIHFVLGKLVKYGDKYKSDLINKALSMRQTTKIHTVFLTIYLNRSQILEYKHITMVQAIQYINDAIWMYRSKSVYERDVDPTNVSVIEVDPLLFERSVEPPMTDLDLLITHSRP